MGDRPRYPISTDDRIRRRYAHRLIRTVRVTGLVEEYLLVWVLLAGGAGGAFPQVAVVTRASIVVLAVIIGSISLTLSADQFPEIEFRILGTSS